MNNLPYGTISTDQICHLSFAEKINFLFPFCYDIYYSSNIPSNWICSCLSGSGSSSTLQKLIQQHPTLRILPFVWQWSLHHLIDLEGSSAKSLVLNWNGTQLSFSQFSSENNLCGLMSTTCYSSVPVQELPNISVPAVWFPSIRSYTTSDLSGGSGKVFPSGLSMQTQSEFPEHTSIIISVVQDMLS